MTLRTSLMLVCLTAATVVAQAPPAQPPPPAQPRSLPVTKVVLYKTGVGYFEHVGPVNGAESITIQFTNAQLDDVLKSLTTVNLGEGRVTGVSYESPTPVAQRLQALRLPLNESASSLQVLGALRGASVVVRTSSGTTVSGRLLNVERRARQANGGTTSIDEISVVTARGEFVALELTPGTRVTLADPDLRRELEEYLNVAGSTRDRDVRRMQIATAGTGSRPLFVSYVTEAAVWKTTYRLVFPDAEGGAPFLQGWAIVDNMSAEDWQDVDLSLVAGAPQAFIQTISQPLFARRPVVPMATGLVVTPQRHEATLVEGRGVVAGVVRDASGGVLPGVVITALDRNNVVIANTVSDGTGSYRLSPIPAGPTTLRVQLPGFRTVMRTFTLPAGATMDASVVMPVGNIEETITVTGGVMLADVQSAARVQRPDRDAIDNIPGGRPSQFMAVRGFNASQTINSSASASDLGDLFEYRLTDRVSIRRNGSALVPILQAPIAAERVSLWNASMGSRPRNAVWLTNTSDLTLDAGSISIVDEGAFAGEGLIETVKPGERRLLSYAADLGVRVSAAPAQTAGRTRVVRVANGVLVSEFEQRSGLTYTIRNENRSSRVVVIEHPIRSDWKVAGTAMPVESSAGTHRFRITVPAHETGVLTVEEIQPGVTQYTLAQFNAAQISAIVEGAEAREALERALAPLFTIRAELARLETERQRCDSELTSLTADQFRVRENMKALDRTNVERRLLERYTNQLEAQETRFEELAQEMAAIAREREAAERELHQLIASLTWEMTL